MHKPFSTDIDSTNRMCANNQTTMARTRALMTEREREWLASETTESGSRKYQVISEIRNRIDGELEADIDVLEEHHPQLLAELREVVCDD